MDETGRDALPAKRTSKIKNRIGEMFLGPSGKMAHLKVWSNIASTLFTLIIIRREWVTENLTDDLLIWYAGLLIAGVVANKGVSLAGRE